MTAYGKSEARKATSAPISSRSDIGWAPGCEHQPHQHAEQHDVEQRVGQRHRDLAEGLGCVGDDRRHHEDPAEHADAHRHDQGVEQAGPIAPGDAALRQPQHGQRDHAHAAQVEDIRHARERLDAVHPVQQHPGPVAGRRQRQADCQHHPRAGVLGPMQPDPREDGDDGQHGGHLVDEVLRVLGQQEIAQAQGDPAARNHCHACARRRCELQKLVITLTVRAEWCVWARPKGPSGAAIGASGASRGRHAAQVCTPDMVSGR